MYNWGPQAKLGVVLREFESAALTQCFVKAECMNPTVSTSKGITAEMNLIRTS